jgi:hypothetical protein
LREEPEKFRQGMELLRNAEAYPNLRPDEVEGKSPEQIARAAIEVSPEFDDRLRSIAERDHKLLVEVLEEALEAYENSRPRPSSR